MKRHTFVVQVHPEGICTLENLSTKERVRISDLETVGPQIERWVAQEREATPRPDPDSGKAPLESTPG